jgi:hypothetical protein
LNRTPQYYFFLPRCGFGLPVVGFADFGFPGLAIPSVFLSGFAFPGLGLPDFGLPE